MFAGIEIELKNFRFLFLLLFPTFREWSGLL